MKKSRLIKMIGGGYMGGMLTALFGVSLLDWKWWLIFVPTVIILEIGSFIEKEED